MSAHDPLVLIIEDEPQMHRFLRALLESHPYRTLVATTAADGLAFVAANMPDIVLLDLGLPDGDGLDVTKRLREWSRIPIVVISARGREADKIEALDAGADDYLTKPFGAGELLARLRVALRHVQQAEGKLDPIFAFGDVTVDLGRRVVSRGGAEVHLTPIEYKLLVTLVQNAGRVVTQGQLLKNVWGPNHVGQSHYLRVYMAQLRHKLEADPARPKFFLTEPGVGYRLVVP